jgi:organic radical activating enzyme
MNIPWNNIKLFGQQTMLDRDLFSVSWILGRFCNYKCSYCWPYARSDSVDYGSLETYTGVVDRIKHQARNNGFSQFHWSFSGGEPTAYRNLLELVQHLSDGDTEYQSIHMTTNLSPGLAWWKKWSENTGQLQRRSITASFHDEFAKEQEFGDKLLLLMEQGVFVTINQVMVPERFDQLYERLVRFSNRGINVTLKPQSNETATSIVEGYTEQQIQVMRTEFQQQASGEQLYQIRLSDGDTDYYLDQAERFNSFGFNKFQGWTCNAGYQSAIIRLNEVKRSYSCHDQPLGTLDSFNLFDTAQKCVTPSCVSSADSKIPKCK